MQKVCMGILYRTSVYRSDLDGVVRRMPQWVSVMGALGRVPLGKNERGCQRLTAFRNMLLSALFSRYR